MTDVSRFSDDHSCSLQRLSHYSYTRRKRAVASQDAPSIDCAAAVAAATAAVAAASAAYHSTLAFLR